MADDWQVDVGGLCWLVVVVVTRSSRCWSDAAAADVLISSQFFCWSSNKSSDDDDSEIGPAAACDDDDVADDDWLADLSPVSDDVTGLTSPVSMTSSLCIAARYTSQTNHKQLRSSTRYILPTSDDFSRRNGDINIFKHDRQPQSLNSWRILWRSLHRYLFSRGQSSPFAIDLRYRRYHRACINNDLKRVLFYCMPDIVQGHFVALISVSGNAILTWQIVMQKKHPNLHFPFYDKVKTSEKLYTYVSIVSLSWSFFLVDGLSAVVTRLWQSTTFQRLFTAHQTHTHNVVDCPRTSTLM